MEIDMRNNNMKTFSALQDHFTNKLMTEGLDMRAARELAEANVMCFVTANFTDIGLKEIILNCKKVFLPEQSELETTRRGSERTLYDEIVDKLMKHQAKLPLSIRQEVSQEPAPLRAMLMLKKMRSCTETMLTFYMSTLGCSNRRFQTNPDLSEQQQIDSSPTSTSVPSFSPPTHRSPSPPRSRIVQKAPQYYEITTPSLAVVFKENVKNRQKDLLECHLCSQPFQLKTPADSHYNWNTLSTTSGQLSSNTSYQPLINDEMKRLYKCNFPKGGGEIYFCLKW